MSRAVLRSVQGNLSHLGQGEVADSPEQGEHDRSSVIVVRIFENPAEIFSRIADLVIDVLTRVESQLRRWFISVEVNPERRLRCAR